MLITENWQIPACQLPAGEAVISNKYGALDFTGKAGRKYVMYVLKMYI